MSIARDLVTLDEKLRVSQADPFSPLEKCNNFDVPEAMGVLQQLESLGFSDPFRVMRLCLQALRVQYYEHKPRFLHAELVATLPPGVPGVARPTGQVLIEMLRAPVREVVLLGYELTDHRTLHLLSEAAQNGADIVMICDRQRGSAERVVREWPAGAPLPRIFLDRDRQGRAPYSSMHAKCVLVDGRDLLITSANFTFHGLEGNIEVGVRLSGEVAAEARKMFLYLVEKGVVVET